MSLTFDRLVSFYNDVSKASRYETTSLFGPYLGRIINLVKLIKNKMEAEELEDGVVHVRNPMDQVVEALYIVLCLKDNFGPGFGLKKAGLPEFTPYGTPDCVIMHLRKALKCMLVYDTANPLPSSEFFPCYEAHSDLVHGKGDLCPHVKGADQGDGTWTMFDLLESFQCLMARNLGQDYIKTSDCDCTMEHFSGKGYSMRVFLALDVAIIKWVRAMEKKLQEQVEPPTKSTSWEEFWHRVDKWTAVAVAGIVQETGKKRGRQEEDEEAGGGIQLQHKKVREDK